MCLTSFFAVSPTAPSRSCAHPTPAPTIGAESLREGPERPPRPKRASTFLRCAFDLPRCHPLVAASYYNPRNRHWEPLLEGQRDGQPAPWEVNVQLLYKSAAALSRRVDDGGDYHGVEVRCSELLLNATHAFLDSLVTSFTSTYRDARHTRPGNSWKGSLSAPASGLLDGTDGGAAGEGDFIVSPYWIRNDTGCTLEYQIRHGPERYHDAESHRVEVGGQTPVAIGSQEQQRLQDLHHQSALLLHVHLRDEVYEADGVLFDQVGARVYYLRRVGEPDAHPARHAPAPAALPSAAGGGGVWLVVVGEVRARENGTNELALRSPVRFRNATETPLELRVHPPAAPAYDRTAFERPMPPTNSRK
eukprot:5572866-Prymnesium_polylepis.1